MNRARPNVPFAISVAALLALALASGAGARAVPAGAVDSQFSAWNTETPGCAVGVSEQGRIVLERAYGMADLEHGVPNRPDTIFEAGSVSKQFTAAAVLLLARDGKLSLDDPVRQAHPGAAGVRGVDHDPPDAASHQRPARLGQHRMDRGLAARHARLHPRSRTRNPRASAPPQFRARHALVLQQLRVQPVRDPRLARRRRVLRRLHAQADLRAARHDAHVLAR